MPAPEFSDEVRAYSVVSMRDMGPLLEGRVVNCGAPALEHNRTLFPVVGALQRYDYAAHRFGVSVDTRDEATQFDVTPPEGHMIGAPVDVLERSRNYRQYAGYSALVGIISIAQTMEVRDMYLRVAFKLAGRNPQNGQLTPIDVTLDTASQFVGAIGSSLWQKMHQS